MILGLSLTVVGTATLPLADFLPMAWRAGWLIVTFLVGYSGLAFYYVNSGPFLLRVTPPGARQHLLAPVGHQRHGLLCRRPDWRLLPGIFAVFMGVTLAQPAPYSTTLFLVSLVIGVALVVLLQTSNPEPAPRSRHPAGKRRTEQGERLWSDCSWAWCAFSRWQGSAPPWSFSMCTWTNRWGLQRRGLGWLRLRPGCWLCPWRCWRLRWDDALAMAAPPFLLHWPLCQPAAAGAGADAAGRQHGLHRPALLYLYALAGLLCLHDGTHA